MELHLAEKAAELEARWYDGGASAQAEARRAIWQCRTEAGRITGDLDDTVFIGTWSRYPGYACRTIASATRLFSVSWRSCRWLRHSAPTLLGLQLYGVDLCCARCTGWKRSRVNGSFELALHADCPGTPAGSRSTSCGLQGLAWPGDKGDMVLGIFPYGAFLTIGETLRDDNPVFSTLFGYVNGQQDPGRPRATLTPPRKYVTGSIFAAWQCRRPQDSV